MWFARFVVGPTVAILAAIAAPAMAANVLYNFNASDGGWTVTSGTVTPTASPWAWTPGPSVNEGGWQAWRGIDPAGSGTYLVSPCLMVDDVDGKYVRMDIRHRFDFGPASSPLALGQVQYQINDGDWLGIRTADFLATSGKIPPSYYPPWNPPFIVSTTIPSGGPYNVEAWVGTTTKFAQGDHQDSQFTLGFDPSSPTPYPLGPGDEIRFRFLMGPQVSADPKLIDWEINKIQIDGVYVCPEPAGIVGVAAAGLVGLAWIAGRRIRPARVAAEWKGTFAVAAAAAVSALALAALARPVEANPVTPFVEYDFATGPKGWVATNANYAGVNYSPNSWAWSAGLWQVDPVAVISRFNWFANYLTSPVLTVPEGADRFDITIRHRFRFPTNITTNDPITAGQFVWRKYDPANPNAPFQAFSNGDEWSTGPVQPPFNTLSPYPNYVVPTFPVPPAYPPLITGDEAFRDASPGWASDFVISGVSLDGTLTPGEQIQLRFIHANLGVECTGGGWDVSLVSISAVAPEPGGVMLAAVGGGVAAGGALLKRRYQRPSSPSDRPVRNTLPPVSVA